MVVAGLVCGLGYFAALRRTVNHYGSGSGRVGTSNTLRPKGHSLKIVELAGRLALALGLAVFLGLAFEEVYKREERSTPGGIRTFPMLALSGAVLYLIEPRQALAFIVGLIALTIWLHPFLR